MNELMDKLRAAWRNISPREQILVAGRTSASLNTSLRLRGLTTSSNNRPMAPTTMYRIPIRRVSGIQTSFLPPKLSR